MKKAAPLPVVAGETMLSLLPEKSRATYAERVRAAEALRAKADSLVVDSPDSKLFASEFLLRVKEKYREIFTEQKTILDPLSAAEKATRTLFSVPLAALSEAETETKHKLEEYALAEKRRAEDAKRRADEEAEKARKVAEKAAADEKERLRKEAEAEAAQEAKGAGLDSTDAAEYVRQAGEEGAASAPSAPTIIPKAVPPPPATSVATLSGRTDTKFYFDFEVENVYALLSAEPTFVECTPRRRMILDRLKATNGKAIPGLKIVERAQIAGNV